MTYIKRFFKFILAALVLLIIGYPCLIISMIIVLPITIVLFLVNYLKTGDVNESSEEALYTAFDFCVLEYGIIPFDWCVSILREF